MQFMHAAFFFFFFLGEKYEYKTYLPKVKKSGDFGCVFQRTKGTISQTCLHGTKNFLALDMFSKDQRFLDMFAKYQGFLDLGYIFRGPKVRDLRNICRKPRIYGLWTCLQRTKDFQALYIFSENQMFQILDMSVEDQVFLDFGPQRTKGSGCWTCFQRTKDFWFFGHVCKGPKVLDL